MISGGATYSGNIALINNYNLPTIGDTKLTGINTHFMEKYYKDLIKMPAVKSTKNPDGTGTIMKSTVNKIHKVLRSCFRQAGADIKEKLEEYKKKKAIEEKKNAVVIFDTKEFREWQYMYEPKDGGILYRFRYKNQMSEASTFLSAKSGSSAVVPLLANEVYRKGEYDKIFYESRIRSEYDIEKLPGHKDIWKITSIVNVTQNKNRDSKVTVRYLKFGNLTKEFKKREKKKTIVIKRKWAFYNNLMEYIHNYADIR